jgi:hypothetical protein
MTKKYLYLALIGLVTLGLGLYLFSKDNKSDLDQIVYRDAMSVSKEYSVLSYKTDRVLINASDHTDYDSWSTEMTSIITDWQALEKQAVDLENNADKLASQKSALKLLQDTHAYNSVEIQKIIESAPMGKQVRTLAKHLGIDAKRAQLILNDSQNRVSREIWGGEGDVYQGLEQDAMRIKNGAKVTVFVGGVVLTGGMSAVATSGVVAKTALVVSGADLVLEVTEDEARIALGDKNKVSQMAGQIRAVTEPAASILTLANIPGNVSKGIEKISAISFVGDQIRSVVQDDKILGISIKTDQTGKAVVTVSGLTESELVEWKKDNDAVSQTQSIEEIIKQIEEESTSAEQTDTPQIKNKKETPKTNSDKISNQVYRLVNVSGSSFMIDACFTPTCWDDLDADPAEDRDLGGIYTLGKVFGYGEGFKKGFVPSDMKASGRLVETSPGSYKVSVYFAIAPFEGPKNKTIDYGTWQNHSIEINANYGDEPVIEWDGSNLKQAK